MPRPIRSFALPEQHADAGNLPSLALLRLDSLRATDGRLRASAAMLVVSPDKHRWLRSGFGRLGTGPVSALHVPAGVVLELDAEADLDGAFALTLAWRGFQPPPRRREILPERVLIPRAVFDALATLDGARTHVIDVARDAPAHLVAAWLLECNEARRRRCQGHRSARQALHGHSDTLASIEEELIARADDADARELPLPTKLDDERVLRRFARTIGCGPLNYVQEYRRRIRAGHSRPS